MRWLERPVMHALLINGALTLAKIKGVGVQICTFISSIGSKTQEDGTKLAPHCLTHLSSHSPSSSAAVCIYSQDEISHQYVPPNLLNSGLVFFLPLNYLGS